MQIIFDHFQKSFSRKGKLLDLFYAESLEITSGDQVAILGPSGSGKSTLLNLIGLVDRSYQGSLRLDGQEGKSLSEKQAARLRNKSFGYVYQEPFLVEKDSIYSNVEIPLLYAGLSKKERKQRIEEVLAQVKLEDRARDPVYLLSGGERQRVSLARAMANRPDFLLADEPTASLDKDLAKDILGLLKRKEEGKSLLLVTHNEELVDAFFNKVWRIVDGHLIQVRPQGLEDQ